MSSTSTSGARRLTLLTIAVIGGLALSPAGAFAAAGVSTNAQFDDQVLQVGQTNRGGFVDITNGNTAPDVGATICRGGGSDGPALPGCAGSEGILLTPSCGAVTFFAFCRSSADVPPGADPDVFRVNPVATGMAGTACAGLVFAVMPVGDQFGKYRFVPPAGANVVLPTPGSNCVIRFTFDVLKSPTRDFEPGVNGLQTVQISEATSQSNIGNQGAGVGASRGRVTTVTRATPSITTTASPDITLGAGTLGDSATVSGRFSPVAGATIDFRLYAPGDTTCAGAPVFESLNVPYPVAGGQVDSARYTPTTVGTYRWRAFYSGDANNAPVAGLCNAASENANVNAVPAPNPPAPNPPAPNPPAPNPPAGQAGGNVIAAPAATPPASSTTVCTPPPDQAPAGTAPNTPTPQSTKFCARGVAAISGPAGCVGKPFRAVVRGTQIARVVFTLDGKVVRTLTKPNSGSVYVLPINPRTLRSGVHRVVATVSFLKKSGTAARTQRVTFSRCKRARAVAAPAFTG